MITWTHTHIDIHMLWTVRYMHMMHIFWTIRPGGSVETVCIMCHGTWTGKQCGALLMTRWVRSASCVSFIWRHGSWFQRGATVPEGPKLGLRIVSHHPQWDLWPTMSYLVDHGAVL